MRPVKGGAARKRRIKVQQKRILAAGLVTEADLKHLGVKEIRELLKKVPSAKK
jgi:hypothetical protein